MQHGHLLLYVDKVSKTVTKLCSRRTCDPHYAPLECFPERWVFRVIVLTFFFDELSRISHAHRPVGSLFTVTAGPPETAGPDEYYSCFHSNGVRYDSDNQIALVPTAAASLSSGPSHWHMIFRCKLVVSMIAGTLRLAIIPDSRYY